jgi:sugar O-acyltransferase (sialic acid O-acetyltransferase NeuD family)
MENPVIIFGANFLGRIAKEIFESNGVVVYGFLDDNKKLHSTELDEVVVLGSTDDDGFLKLIGKKCEAFVALDDNKLRRSVVKLLHEARHVQPVNATHKLASLSLKTEIGYGNLFDQNFSSGPGASIGSHCLLHAGSHVGAEAKIGDYVQLGAGTMINSGVTIEDDVFIGSGATVVAGVSIGKGARIGAGSVVIAPVRSGETVFGNPAQKIKS